MKRRVLAVTITTVALLLAGSSTAFAQLASMKKFFGSDAANSPFRTKNAGEEAPPVYDVIIGTGTIPITFSKLVKGDDGNYHVGAQLSLGAGYIAVIGKMTPNTDKTVRIDPKFILGLAGDIGVRDSGSDLKTAVSLGGIVGFNIVAVNIGYDFLGKSPYIGLSGKIDFFALKRDAFQMFSCHEEGTTTKCADNSKRKK